MTNPAVSEEMVERALDPRGLSAARVAANEFFKTLTPIEVSGDHLEFPPNVTDGLFRAAIAAYLSAALPLPVEGVERRFIAAECDANCDIPDCPYTHVGVWADEPVATPAAGPSAVAVKADIETQAWECDKWPKWLHDIVALTNDVADRLDMSSEQAHAYAVLSCLSALAPSAAAGDEAELLERTHESVKQLLSSPSAEAAQPVADAEAHAEATRVFWEHPGGWKDSFDAALQAYSVALSQPQGGLREALAPFISDAAEIAPGIPDDTGFWMEGYETLGFADFTVGDLRKLALAGRAAG